MYFKEAGKRVFNIKIGDFGISRVLNDQKKYTISMIGTPNYISPELINE
jgi:serine/threonine protein kinase